MIWLKQFANRALRRAGYQASRYVPPSTVPPLHDLDEATRAIVSRCLPYTMTSQERLAATCSAAEHVISHKVPGAFVECGVWKGGSTMAAVFTFARLGATDRDIY